MEVFLMQSKLGTKITEGQNTKAVRGLMIGLAALVVLSVSGYGTVIYIQLMGKVYPSGGPLLIACYMGAAASFLLMLVLLVGKFTWFRPGAHEVASWIVTGVELLVAILNMMLAYQLASGQHPENLMQAWYQLAPVSPVFSMVGAIALIMTSTELRKRHKQQEMQDEAELAEHELEIAMHHANLGVRRQYLEFVKAQLGQELNAPQRQAEIAHHASRLVTNVLTEMSGLPALQAPNAPQLSAPRVVNAGQELPSGALPSSFSQTGELNQDDYWFDRVNQRLAQARQNGFSGGASGEAQPKEADDEPLSPRVRSLIEQAEASGVDLGEIEGMLRLPHGDSLPYGERALIVMNAAQQKGYSLDQIEQALRLYARKRGGDDATKKVADGDGGQQEQPSKASIHLKYRSS
jgi:hypothetical protein